MLGSFCMGSLWRFGKRPEMKKEKEKKEERLRGG